MAITGIVGDGAMSLLFFALVGSGFASQCRLPIKVFLMLLFLCVWVFFFFFFFFVDLFCFCFVCVVVFINS